MVPASVRLAATLLLLQPLVAAPQAQAQAQAQVQAQVQVPATSPLAALEARAGGRLGVAALDTGSGRRLEHRGDERFPLCSTFKVLLAGAVLARTDQGRLSLDQRLAYGPADLLEHAPVVRAHGSAGSLTVDTLCAAAVEVSDNTAANLLLQALGGPAALTAFARDLGDPTTRLDRTEPSLNSALPGDPRDTTTPAAMVETLRTLLLGSALRPASRQRLEAWMVAATTGRAKLRAGLPPGWLVGDKTGAGDHGTMNDIAILRPPGRAPILVAAYFTGSPLPSADREAVLAEVGRQVAAAFRD